MLNNPIDPNVAYSSTNSELNIRPYMLSGSKNNSYIIYQKESAVYGGDVYSIVEDDSYVYVVGGTTSTVRKLNKSDMSLAAESASYGGPVYAIAENTTHIFISGATTRKVRKLLKTTLAFVADSPRYGSDINAFSIDTTNVYMGGGVIATVWANATDYVVGDRVQGSDSNPYRCIQAHNSATVTEAVGKPVTGTDWATYWVLSTAYPVIKCLLSDMTYVAESATYGGTISAIAADSIAEATGFIYFGGATTQTVRKLTKATATFAAAASAESAGYGGTIRALKVDTTHVFVGGGTTNAVKKLPITDLTTAVVTQPVAYGGDIRGIAIDGDYVFIGGSVTFTLQKLQKSDLVKAAESASYGTEIQGIAVDDNFAYFGGWTTQTVQKHLHVVYDSLYWGVRG